MRKGINAGFFPGIILHRGQVLTNIVKTGASLGNVRTQC